MTPEDAKVTLTVTSLVCLGVSTVGLGAAWLDDSELPPRVTWVLRGMLGYGCMYWATEILHAYLILILS